MIGYRTFMLHSINNVGSKFCSTPDSIRQIADKTQKNLFTFDDGYVDNLTYGRDVFAKLGNRAVIFLVAGKVGGVNDWDTEVEFLGKQLLNWDEILELKSLGVKFGSHSLTHADLRKLSDKELEKEVKESRKILEENLGQAVEGFSYPFGYFNERVITAVKNAGYKWAVTTSDSIWEGIGNPYRMRRINISGLDPDWLLRAKVNGFYDIKAIWELPLLAFEKSISKSIGKS